MATALEADDQHRQVAHAQLAGPGPEPDRDLADRSQPSEPGHRLQVAGHRGPDQQVMAAPADEVVAPVAGHSEQGLVDVDDEPILEPDDDHGI